MATLRRSPLLPPLFSVLRLEPVSLGFPRTRPIRHSPCIYFLDLLVNHDITLHDQCVGHFAIDDRTARSAPWSLKPNVKPLVVAKDRTTDVCWEPSRPMSIFHAISNFIFVTCPNQGLTNCDHCTDVQYRDSEPSKPLKRICGYNPPQCLVFLSVPPNVIERDPRVGLARIFRTVTMGNFPRIYSTHQLSLCHSPFYLFFLLNLNQRRISAYLHSPVVLSTLAVSGEFLPAFVIARGTQRNRDLRVIPRTLNSR